MWIDKFKTLVAIRLMLKLIKLFQYDNRMIIYM